MYSRTLAQRVLQQGRHGLLGLLTKERGRLCRPLGRVGVILPRVCSQPHMYFTYQFFQALHARGSVRCEYDVRKWRRTYRSCGICAFLLATNHFYYYYYFLFTGPLFRGLIPCLMTDAIVCVLCLRVAVETCSPLYATLLLVRGMNPFLSILYHCFDLNILRCQSWTSESSVRRLDIFWILVATLSDLTYGQYIMGIPNSLPNDVLVLFALGTLLMPLGTHASWLLLSQLTLGMFMVRAAYVGYTTLPEPVLWCVRSVPLGIVLNVYDEYRPEGSNREYSAGLRKYLGTYDMVHVCWFLDIVFMMHLGDRPLSFVKTGEAFALQSTPMQSAMLFVSVFTGAAATCAVMAPSHTDPR